MVKRSLRHLRELNLNVTIGYDVYDEFYGIQIAVPRRRDHLDSALYNLIKAAPMLGSLLVSFEIHSTVYKSEPKHIVSDHHWTNLRRVKTLVQHKQTLLQNIAASMRPL